jgi:glycosyltransferase involved in cell wall biosynthesis
MLRELAGGKPFDAPQLVQSSLLRGAERLSSLYRYFLRRPADPDALRRGTDRCGTLYGYLRTAAGLARSAEARMHPNWLLHALMWPLHVVRNRVAQDPPGVAAAGRRTTDAPASLSIGAGVGPDAERVPGINLVGYIAAELGVGEAARSLARACVAAKVPYSVFDVGYQSSNLQRDRSALEHATHKHFPIDLVYVNADQTAVTVNHLRATGALGAYRIGFWHWEQPRFPDRWLDAFTHLDEVWVPSTFVRDAVAAVSPLPVHVVPHALQFAASPGVRRSDFGLPEDKLLVLVMYDFHSYQYRKNPQAAIAAFRAAAAGREDAVLVLKTINGEHHPEALAQVRASLADLPGTVMIDSFLTRQQVWDLQSCCDMLVSLHRAEGFGLGPAEMMFLGKPVVATGWSANTDFMTAENSMPVRYTLKPLEQDVGAYPAGPDWAEADIGHAAECIRRLLDDPGLRSAVGARASRDIRAQLDPEAVGRKVRERLQAIAMWHPKLQVL